LVITSLNVLLFTLLSELRHKWLVLVIGPHSKGVAIGTICWCRTRVTRGGGAGAGAGTGTGAGANNYTVRVAKITCLYFLICC